MVRQPPETITVDDDTDEVCCDGGGGALGHPKVWYSFTDNNVAECGYCDRLFIKKSALSSDTEQTANG